MGWLAVTNFNVVISVVGGWMVLVGIFSHLLSDSCYLSEAREPSSPLTQSVPRRGRMISPNDRRRRN